jgi:hypothetical protein
MVGDFPFFAMSEQADGLEDEHPPCPVKIDNNCISNPSHCFQYDLHRETATRGCCSGDASRRMRECAANHSNSQCVKISERAQLDEWFLKVALMDDRSPRSFRERIRAEIEDIPWETMQQCITWVRQCVTDAFLRVKHWPLEPSQEMG